MPGVASVLLFSLSFLLSNAACGVLDVPRNIQQSVLSPAKQALWSCQTSATTTMGAAVSRWPIHNRHGSMMTHAGNGSIFWATVVIAGQGFDNSSNLRIRHHITWGWLGERSTTTDDSGPAAGDSDGVGCHLCHKKTNPNGSQYPEIKNNRFAPNNNDLFDFAGGLLCELDKSKFRRSVGLAVNGESD